jgi:hypothetical protein
MMALDIETIEIDRLAWEVGRVGSAGFGCPLRGAPDVKQLQAVCQALAKDPTVQDVPLFEEALKPSIERLGNGNMGQIARIEFRLTERSKRLPYRHQRLGLARSQMGGGENRIEAMAKAAHLAIAKDLRTRITLLQPQ